jgi:lipoate-protein ligase A
VDEGATRRIDVTSNGRAALSGRPRLLPLAAASPARNMAIDAALLATATRPTLRFYLWRPNGVSLGRFQDAAAAAPFREAGLPVVRRMTGGGAIVHADEITYSILLPDDHALLLGLDVKASYAALHRPIREALASLGVATETRDVPVPTHKARDGVGPRRARQENRRLRAAPRPRPRPPARLDPS